jgi:DNA polymerase-4
MQASFDRVIGHVDMDSFYASVEVRDDPSLAGKPLAVGGSAERRGVVSSASYEARRYGVRSAMPTATALQKCPDLIVLPGRMGRYQEVSHRLMAILREFSPLVEPLSLDEAFLDLSGADRLLGTPVEIGTAIRERIRRELGLTASVGISNSKFVAKLASDHEKPDGLTVIPPETVVAFVQSLPLERLWGVGPATREALRGAGIRTIAALARASEESLTRVVGSSALHLRALARGEDDRPVIPDTPPKSLSHETTFAVDQTDEEVLEGVLLSLAEKVAQRARANGLGGRTVTLKLRLPDFTTLTRSRTLPTPTRDAGEIFRESLVLFRSVHHRGEGVRLLGVGISGFTTSPQLELGLHGDPGHERDPDPQRLRHLHAAEDEVVGRFGRKALGRARSLLSRSVEDTGSMEGRPRPEKRQG